LISVLTLSRVDWNALGEMAGGIGSGYHIEYHPGGPPAELVEAYAQAKGTYYTGAVTSLPTGPGPHVVFIDTTDGSTFTNSTPTSKDGSLSLSGNNTFNGAVFVAGSVNVAGNTTINGLIYSLNDLSISGTVTVNGAVISENRRDTSSTNIDTDFSGNVHMKAAPGASHSMTAAIASHTGRARLHVTIG